MRKLAISVLAVVSVVTAASAANAAWILYPDPVFDPIYCIRDWYGYLHCYYY